MAPRRYGMQKRAEAQERTRERILAATMQLHDEQGVARTTFADIAARADVAPATVQRHFPTLGDLVRNCGMHVWQEMQPPVPEAAPAIFEGIEPGVKRIEAMVAYLDDFYLRGELRLHLAGRDRELIPELEQFLGMVQAGVHAVVAEGLDADPAGMDAGIVAALLSFPSWREYRMLDLEKDERRTLLAGLVQCALKAGARLSRS